VIHPISVPSSHKIFLTLVQLILDCQRSAKAG
jgi:hypothetical protein